MKIFNRCFRVIASVVCCLLLLEAFTACGVARIVQDITEQTSDVSSAELSAGAITSDSSDPDDDMTEPTEGSESVQESSAVSAGAQGTESETVPTEPPSVDVPKYHIGHPELTYSYTEENEAALRESIDALEALIKIGEASDADMLTAYDATELLIYELREQYQLAYVESYLYKNDSDIAEDYLYLSSFYNDIVQQFVSLYRTIEQSTYQEAFFEGWTEEEIEEVLSAADTYDAECAALNSEIEALQHAQRALSEAEYEQGSVEIYRRLIDKENALAAKLGYSGYMEYAYADIYGRDYTPENADVVAGYVKESLVMVLENAYTRLMTTNLSGSDVAVLQEILYGSFESEFGQQILEGYYSALGGEIYETYRDFCENGYYYIGYDETESEAGAFTFYLDIREEPVIYFGPGYQDLFNFVHEFGHYYAYVKHGSYGDVSYDLAETQSQGDEWLFLAYLGDEVLGNSSAMTYLESYYTANCLLSAIVCLTVNEFERNAYTVQDIEDFDILYQEACDTVYSYHEMEMLLGYPPEKYWRGVVIENPGYYISYAVSQIPSMELYAYADTDFQNAAVVYERVQSEEGSFLEVLAAAGLGSPFEGAVYERIKETLR